MDPNIKALIGSIILGFMAVAAGFIVNWMRMIPAIKADTFICFAIFLACLGVFCWVGYMLADHGI